MSFASRCAFPFLIAGALSASAAPGGGLVHEPLRCIPSSGNAKVLATWTGAGQVTTARVYFRAAGAKEESFLELRRGTAAKAFWAVLPVPGAGVETIRYRIALRDSDGREASAGPAEARVTSTCPVTLSPEEAAYARNLVVGRTSVSQPAVPTGFSCAGMVASISSGGEMRALPPCMQMVAAAKAPAGARPARAEAAPLMLDDPPLVVGGQAPVSGTIPTPGPTPPPVSPARPQ
ncbi:MAG: hypothetical protein KBB14_07590 [Thermoanaerobaculia bacterium]|nr:hypothetical protein [Thermoanaerobaculia bacterium]